MSFKANQWEDGIRWNGVVFPATRAYAKSYKDRNPAIQNAESYKKQETGDVTFDMWTHHELSLAKQAFAIEEIDRIKKLDVPWKLYLAIYLVLLTLATILCIWMGFAYLFDTWSLMLSLAGFLACITGAFGLITFFGFMAEEEKDAKKLCNHLNQIKIERKMQLNYGRMNQKIHESVWGRSQEEIDDAFIFRVNQIRG